MSIILNIECENGYLEVNVTKKKVILGRSSKADLTIDDERISGKHCSIQLSEVGKVLLKDLGSTNGTFLGASQIDNAEIMIGDKVRIGNTILSIAESELTPKEAKALKKSEDATQVRYLDLQSSEDSTRHAINIRKKAIKKEKQKQENNIEPVPKAKEEESEEDNIGELTNTQQKLKEQLIQKAKKLKSGSNRGGETNYDSKHSLEMEPETGKTGLIQIDKIIKGAKTKKPYKSNNKNDDEESESSSFLNKIKSLFKKK